MKTPHVISHSQYEEYQRLKERYERDLTLESIRSVSLEYDIDDPVRKCVMAMALLVCNPTWSCCGFDYDGQPIHKSHDYGRVYFGMEACQRSNEIVSRFFMSKTFLHETWEMTGSNNDGIGTYWLSNRFVRKENWQDRRSIHYSELAVTRIGYFEMFLLSLKDEMADEFTLKDHNALYRRRFPFWQYPAKEPWLIRKSDLVPHSY